MIVNKPYTNKEYADLAVYCNDNGMIIADKGEYLESVLPPEPTVEELQVQVRAVRNNYLETYVDPKQLVMVWDELSVDERNTYSDYRRYLLDYTENDDWYLSNPMTLDEWKIAYNAETEELGNTLQDY
jgi:hypothetical protein